MAGAECQALCCAEVLEPLSQTLLAAVLRCHDGLVNILWDCWRRKTWQGRSTWSGCQRRKAGRQVQHKSQG